MLKQADMFEWLKHCASTPEFGDWSTSIIADAYGGDEADEINARIGCIAYPLASEDKALHTFLLNPRWAFLAPLTGIKALWRELREPRRRVRKAGDERLKDGRFPAHPQRMRPLNFAARLMALARIRELIRIETWPNGWHGDEMAADIAFDFIYPNRAMQPRLP
jgi:DNA sulfur modification protein DndC